MGLAGQKNRTKLSADPNNTAWANSIDTYGQKILRSQGWQPGDYLGARDASHADHYTTANASHIRVLLREDNLGIGAQKGKANAETFGLSLFSGLLGRLNGKSDEDVQKQQSAQRDVELRTFTSQKYGFMNFVRGGLLVGDKIEENVGNVPRENDAQVHIRKRKIEDVENAVDSETSTKRKKRKDQKADSANRKTDEHTSQGEEGANGLTQRSKDKKRRNYRPDVSEQEAVSASVSNSTSEIRDGKEKRKKSRSRGTDDSESKAEKRRLKEEKRARREERRRQKEEKRRLKNGDKETPSATVTTSTSTINSANTSGTSTPLPASMAFGGSRHAVRQRYIQQKRLASMNAQSLNEIFMLKSAA